MPCRCNDNHIDFNSAPLALPSHGTAPIKGSKCTNPIKCILLFPSIRLTCHRWERFNRAVKRASGHWVIMQVISINLFHRHFKHPLAPRTVAQAQWPYHIWANFALVKCRCKELQLHSGFPTGLVLSSPNGFFRLWHVVFRRKLPSQLFF